MEETLSKLDLQIKELQTKKLTIDYYRHIKDLIVTNPNINFKEIAEDVHKKLSNFVDIQIKNLEENNITEIEIPPQFNKEEIDMLKLLVKRALNKSLSDVKIPVTPNKAYNPPSLPNSDLKFQRIDFIKKMTPYENKNIQVKLPDGDIIPGIVHALDYPKVVILLNTGNKLSVNFEDLIL